jgi:eukaryotic-like serine/threonine-protein kinase
VALAYQVAAPRDVACVRFSHNGQRLAMVGYDSLVYLCDARSGYRLLTLDGSVVAAGTIEFTPRVIFSPDGRRIATNDWQGRITIWKTGLGEAGE